MKRIVNNRIHGILKYVFFIWLAVKQRKIIFQVQPKIHYSTSLFNRNAFDFRNVNFELCNTYEFNIHQVNKKTTTRIFYNQVNSITIALCNILGNNSNNRNEMFRKHNKYGNSMEQKLNYSFDFIYRTFWNFNQPKTKLFPRYTIQILAYKLYSIV